MEFAERLRGELSGLLDVICQAGGGVVLEEFPGALEEDARDAEILDGGNSAVRGALIEEANRLAEALVGLRHGDDGVARREAGDGLARSGPERRLAPAQASSLTRPL